MKAIETKMNTIKNIVQRTLQWAVCAVVMAGYSSHAAGLLKAKGGEDNGLAIKSHQVHVVINNGFARTEIDQVFVNHTDRDMEALYSYPLPKQSSLSELSLWIDGNETLGEVVEKEQARRIYEEQVAQGNDTALAEKNDFKSYDVSVGLVRARSEVRVRMVYYQPLEIDLNVGRYLYPIAEGGVDDERIAFWSVDDRVECGISFKLVLKSAFPIKDVRVPGYDTTAQIKYVTPPGENHGEVYEVTIQQSEGGRLSKDIVVYYRLNDSVPARVELVPYREKGGEPGTFMAVITPAASLKQISEGTDWVFVLDTSGSMSGSKISTLADGMARLLGKMSPNDRFCIVTFNSSAHNFSRGFVSATPESVAQWIQQVKNLKADGSTALFEGLELGYRALDADRTSGVILVTDGVCNVGPTAHSAFLELLRKYDVRLFTFVIGNSANQPLMERLALDSGGFAMNISNEDDIIGRLLQAKAKVLHQCMHDVELVFHGEKVRDLTPARIGNLYLGQQVVAFGRYTGSGEVDVELRAKISGEAQSWHCRATLPEQDGRNPEIERLWALSRIDETMQEIRENGEKASLRKKVVDLGLEYSLVTDYTSMLVVREDVLENQGIARRNADRVQRERQAQSARENAPAASYRVDNGGTFQGQSSPGIGTGPVGPLFLLVAGWLAVNKRKNGKINPKS
ncbi:MAG: VIT domain-containing protein [Lentisphaerota bacterium]